MLCPPIDLRSPRGSSDGKAADGSNSLMTDAMRALPGSRAAAGGEQPKQKPSSLVYGAAEKVPASLAFLNALQHVAVMLPVLVFPLLVGLAGGLQPAPFRALLWPPVVRLR